MSHIQPCCSNNVGPISSSVVIKAAKATPMHPPFSIDDALEEETDEAMQGYDNNTCENSDSVNSCATNAIALIIEPTVIVQQQNGYKEPSSPSNSISAAITLAPPLLPNHPNHFKDSDSLIQGGSTLDSGSATSTAAPGFGCYYYGPGGSPSSYYGANGGTITTKWCFQHPKVRENWRMVLAATSLLIIGAGLILTAIVSLADGRHPGLQGYVFFLAGFICFVPGAYHVVYIYLAAKGIRGYHFHNLPLFT